MEEISRFIFTELTTYRWGMYKTFVDKNIDGWAGIGWICFSVLIIYTIAIAIVLFFRYKSNITYLKVYIPMTLLYLVTNFMIHSILFLVLFSLFSIIGLMTFILIYTIWWISVSASAWDVDDIKGVFNLMAFTVHYSDHISKYITYKYRLKEKYNKYLSDNLVIDKKSTYTVPNTNSTNTDWSQYGRRNPFSNY